MPVLVYGKGGVMGGLVPEADFSAAEIVAQLERICSSSLFFRATSLQQLLRYLVTEAAEGRGSQLSRKSVYDNFRKRRIKIEEESLSTYKKRIQKKLDRYYASATTSDQIRITLRPDSFQPSFSPPGSIRPIVGRDADLQRFQEFYGRNKDRLSIVSISGISGIGKTTLAEMILKAALATGGIEHVVSVYGPSDSRSGSPYLPFRDCLVEILDKVGKTAVALRDEFAPSWRDTSKHGVASELGIFFQKLTKQRPMAVFIDNFHLSDYSSEGLLSELARTGFGSKLLVIVAFREFELSSLRHPYVEAERRLQRERKCLRLQPQSISISDVREYLQRRFPQNLFPPDLARIVHEYCQGIPLHLVNLVDHLERFEIVWSNGHRALTRSPDQIANELSVLSQHSTALPVISVTDDQRHLLAVAALLGDSFESALLADVVQEEPGAVERDLDTIYRTHRLIDARPSAYDGSSVASVRYRFSHSSYRDAFLAIFDTLPTERARLANRAIDLLSKVGPVDSATHSARIAALLESAGRFAEAVRSYTESAELSSRKFAHGTAALLARRAIHLLPRLNAEDAMRSLRMQLNILLGMAVMSTSGFAAQELEDIHQRLIQDALVLGDAAGEMIGLYGLWVYSIDSGQIERSMEYANALLSKAVEAKDDAAEVEAHYAKGTSLIQLGRLLEARNEFAAGLTKAGGLGLRSHWFYQLDAAVSIRSQCARALWFSGESHEGQEMAKRAYEIAEETSHPESRAYALVFLADLAHLRRDVDAALKSSEQAISAAVDCGASQELAWAQMIRAWALGQDDGDELTAISELEHSFAFYKGLNARVALTKFYCLAAEVYLRQGKTEEAIRQLEAAEKEVLETNEVYFESEVYRLRGIAWLALGDNSKAVESFRQSYSKADRLTARALQLRTALALYTHRNDLGISEGEARALLHETCSAIPAQNIDPEVHTAREILGTTTV